MFSQNLPNLWALCIALKRNCCWTLVRMDGFLIFFPYGGIHFIITAKLDDGFPGLFDVFFCRGAVNWWGLCIYVPVGCRLYESC